MSSGFNTITSVICMIGLLPLVEAVTRVGGGGGGGGGDKFDLYFLTLLFTY